MEIDILETAKGAWAVIAPIAGGTGVWAYLKSRASKHSSPSQMMDSQAALVIAVDGQTQTILAENTRLRKESNGERRVLKRDVKVLMSKVAQLSSDVAECNGRHQECEENLARVREDVAQYMCDNPPAEPYDTIKRVGPKEL